MASLKIEGDIQGVRSKQIEFIRDVLTNRGFKDNRVIFEAGTKAGDNYAANVKRITVKVDGDKDFKMFAKFAPDQSSIRDSNNGGIMFKNEIVMYEKVLPKFVSLQKAAGVPEKEWLRYAECYGCFSEEPNEVVLLEDLKELNYEMLGRFTYLNDEAVRLILKNFAIFHSLSYVLKKQEPDVYEDSRNLIEDVMTKTFHSDQFKMFMVNMEEGAVAIVDDKYKKYFEGSLVHIAGNIKEVMEADKDSSGLVVQQGDAWTNNILFKFDGKKLQDCIMIDYQLAKESKPVCDILYMVFNGTNHATREKHYLDWLDYYHDQLDKSLSYFGMAANEVYPRDQMDSDLRKYSKPYFGSCIMLSCMLTINSEEAKVIQDAMKENDLDKMEHALAVDSLSNETTKLFKNRLEDLVESYRLFGYI